MTANVVDPDMIPDGWEEQPGEASRPLHTGGYYMHRYINVLFENQHVRRQYACLVDTAGYTPDRGPDKHIVQFDFEEVDHDGDTRRYGCGVQTETVKVDCPTDPEAQTRAEQQAHAIAIKIMSDLAGDEIRGPIPTNEN